MIQAEGHTKGNSIVIAEDNGIPAGTKFEDLPEDWHCPRCKQGKDKFYRA